jgi:hypothetical protein
VRAPLCWAARLLFYKCVYVWGVGNGRGILGLGKLGLEILI